jgi:hypothetical protein
MSFIGTVAAVACAATLIIPQAASAQTADRLRDSLRIRDSIGVQRQRTGVTPTPVTSQERVRVQKEIRGESQGTLAASTTARDDSIAAESRRREAMERARLDSVERSAQVTRDSLANVERLRVEAVARDERLRLEAIETARRDSVARADALAEAERVRREQQGQYLNRGSGWYVGVALGGVIPTGNLKNLGYNSGANVNVPIGYHKPGQLFGVRMDLGYAQFRGRDFSGKLVDGSTYLLNNSSPKVLSATLNVTAHAALTASKKLSAYALAGVGGYQFRSFGNKSALGGFFGNDVLTPDAVGFQSVRNKVGAQFGAGLEYAVGPVGLYVESRVVNVFANRTDNVKFNDFLGANRGQNIRWVPIMLGVNFR